MFSEDEKKLRALKRKYGLEAALSYDQYDEYLASHEVDAPTVGPGKLDNPFHASTRPAPAPPSSRLPGRPGERALVVVAARVPRRVAHPPGVIARAIASAAPALGKFVHYRAEG